MSEASMVIAWLVLIWFVGAALCLLCEPRSALDHSDPIVAEKCTRGDSGKPVACRMARALQTIREEESKKKL